MVVPRGRPIAPALAGTQIAQAPIYRKAGDNII
jgi:hypothetical protein